MLVAVIDYGAGNLASLKYALERCGVVNINITSDPKVIRKADRVIFPGVGHAAFAMQKLKQKNLDEIILSLKQPVLGICLGMQLMCAYSEEGEVDGLGIFKAKVRRFGSGLKVPHMGWNTVKSATELGSDNYFYFVHSYYVESCPQTIAVCHYGTTFSAVLRHDNFTGCQFHPEKSGEAGEQFLKHFLS